MQEYRRSTVGWLVRGIAALTLAGVVGGSSVAAASTDLPEPVWEPATAFDLDEIPATQPIATVESDASTNPAATGVDEEPAKDDDSDRRNGQADEGASAEHMVASDEVEAYDPWRPFNERVFWFNRQFDRRLVKPVATGWDRIVPDPVQRGVRNTFDNLGMPRRLVNNLLQLKLKGVGTELGRFFLNSTVGVAGLFDVGKEVGLEKSDEDTGQTLGVWGVGPGPYLVLPFSPPFTVRDAIGGVADQALNPLIYLRRIGVLLGLARGGQTVNERSLTLEEETEESRLDIYAALRNNYLERRQKAIGE